MSKPINSNTIFQSYIALGLEPGASWINVQQRHKDLIMAWHPDRFLDNKQKGKAESELKKINAARDILHKHFQKEHKQSGLCSCQFQPTENEKPTQSHTPAGQSQSTRSSAQTTFGSKSLKAQAATLALLVLSLITVIIYHKLAISSQSKFINRETFNSPQTSTIDLFPNQLLLKKPNRLEVQEFLFDSTRTQISNPIKVHNTPGNFYTSYLRHEKERKKQVLSEKRSELTKAMDSAEKFITTANIQLADLKHKLDLVQKEMAEHQSIIDEAERINSDLTQTSSRSTEAIAQLYYSSPEFKKHKDMLEQLTKQQTNLQGTIVNLNQKIMQEKISCKQAKDKLVKLQNIP